MDPKIQTNRRKHTLEAEILRLKREIQEKDRLLVKANLTISALKAALRPEK